MAQITLYEEWGFRVSKRELLLILKALGGRIRHEDEIAEAKALGDRLTKNKADELENVTSRLKAAVTELGS